VVSTRDATDAGIATVYQDLALCDNLDIVANMLLGHEIRRHLLLDEVTMEQMAKKTLSDLRVVTVRNIRQPVGSLSGGQRQSVAVAKAVMQEAKLVIMDEPTAALGVTQTALVLDLIRRLADRGIAVLVVSHNLTDVFQVANRVAVLYLGGLASVGPASEYDPSSVVELMTTVAWSGTAAQATVPKPRQRPGGLTHDIHESCTGAGQDHRGQPRSKVQTGDQRRRWPARSVSTCGSDRRSAAGTAALRSSST
jgi:ABC-type sugar transport system ATPase subunit